MNTRSVVKVKWHTLKRSRVFFLLIISNYYLLAFFDTKFPILMRGIEQHIYRFTHQQFYIVISCVLMVNIIFNEKYLDSIKNYLLIYIKDLKMDVYASFWVISLSNIFAFLLGQILLLLVNYYVHEEIILSLFLVNALIVSIEIMTAVLLVMALRLLLKKNILVYGIFTLIVFFSIAINNVFVSLPLTIRILGADENGYYLTYGINLWIGRIFLLSMSYSLFRFGLKKFTHDKG